MIIYNASTVPAYEVKREIFNNKQYLVVPVTMMVEGVHSGSHGPLLHLASELGKITESWNGIPVTIYHPQNEEGSYVSANSPEILTEYAAGIVFNTRMDGTSLKAEIWFEEDRLKEVSPETYERVEQGDVIEVSVGVFSEEETTAGQYKGENYIAIARNHRPDHLAVLPRQKGACSVEDGCGIRTNQKGGDMFILNEENQSQVFKELAAKGLSVNSTGYYELANKAQATLNVKDTGTASFYLEEIFENELVFKVYTYDPNGGGRNVKFYKQSFQENAAGEVELIGEAVQVKRVVSYPNVPQANVTKRVRKNPIINNSKNEEMCTECVKKLANNLIANKSTAFQESDREWLETLSEEQLEKMTPQPVASPQANTLSKEQAITILQGMTTEEYYGILPKEVREQVQAGLRINAEKRSTMIAEITANEKSPWKKEELEALPTETLEKIHQTVKVNSKEEEVPVYGAFGSSIQANKKESGIAPMIPIIN